MNSSASVRRNCILIQKKWQQFSEKIVVLQPITFRTKREYNLHRILRAVDRNTLLSKLNEDDVCRTSETLKPPAEVLNDFKDHRRLSLTPKKSLTNVVSSSSLVYREIKSISLIVRIMMRNYCENWLTKVLKFRYPENDRVARKRVEKELKVINQLNFSGYFLITWDIVQYSRRRGFMHVGRVVGANSIVSYCLGITDICPIELDLYFEKILKLKPKITARF